MRRSTQIIIASLAWLAGLALALIIPDQVTWLVGVLAVICLVCLIIVKSKLGYIVIGLAFIMLGLLRGQAGLQAEAVSISSLIGDKPVIRGRVLGEPGWNNDHLYEFYLTDLKIDERKIGGILKVKSLTGAILEGQQVELTGKLGRALGRAGATASNSLALA